MAFTAFEYFAAATGITGATVVPEEQNSDYESGTVRLDGEKWHIRTARNTPSKPGAFVAFWRRGVGRATRPFDEHEVAAGLLVFVTDHDRRGVFRFTSTHLAELRVTTGRGPGKRGFRVYPAWCTDLNAQATRTQRNQAPAFHQY